MKNKPPPPQQKKHNTKKNAYTNKQTNKIIKEKTSKTKAKTQKHNKYK